MTLKEEITYYAGLGMSIRATALVIGTNHSTLTQIVHAEGLRHLFNPKQYAQDCCGGNRKGCPRPYYKGADGRIWKPSEPSYHYLAARNK